MHREGIYFNPAILKSILLKPCVRITHFDDSPYKFTIFPFKYDMANWQDIQDSVRNCPTCKRLEGSFFSPFKENWPTLPQPGQKAILFISEAPPKDGGFWTIQPLNAKQDDLREKLLPLLQLSPSGTDRGLKEFCDTGYYLLQTFPRPLKFGIGNTPIEKLKTLLDHPVRIHLQQQITFFQPSGILALGKPASLAISIIFPKSGFANTFENGSLTSVRGKIFKEPQIPILSATFLPSGNGRFWQHFWGKDIPFFVKSTRGGKLRNSIVKR